MPTYHVVAAVIFHNGEILCVQKPQTRFPYTSFHWEFPGGKVEKEEKEEEALTRELMEEMDYSIQPLGLLTRKDYTYPDFSVHLSFYLCTPTSISAPRQFTLREHIAARWVQPQFIPWVGNPLEETTHYRWCAADYGLTALPSAVSLFPRTAFQEAVWQALCSIPAGETRTYSQIATLIHRPTAVRAVAHAIHCNPLPYFIPCHRVVAKTDIGGYAIGKNVKRLLLNLEKCEQSLS